MNHITTFLHLEISCDYNNTCTSAGTIIYICLTKMFSDIYHLNHAYMYAHNNYHQMQIKIIYDIVHLILYVNIISYSFHNIKFNVLCYKTIATYI